MKPGIKKSRWEKIRHLAQDIHLYMGLTCGLVIIAVCFSGTVYVYNTEATEMAAPHLYNVKPHPGAILLPVATLTEKVNKAAGAPVVSMKIPADPYRTYQFTVKKKENDKGRFGTTYMVNPYTGEIVGSSKEESRTKRFMSNMFSLHRWLLLDKIESPVFKSVTNRELGSIITGTATILFTLGCITGMIIWFPNKVRNWRQGLKIKWNANWKRVNHDLHNTLAFYSLIFLLIMGLTGPQWSFEWYRTGLQKALGTYQPKKAEAGGPRGIAQNSEGRPESRIREVSSADTLPGGEQKSSSRTERKGKRESEHIAVPLLKIEDYLKTADTELPYRGDYMLSLPAGAQAPLTITKTRTGFFAPAAGDKLTLDAQSAQALKKEIFREKPFNERVAGSIKALHVGNVYGGFTKLLYFLACLVATSLPVTGTLIWLNKLKKKRKRTLVLKSALQRA